jgi:hypothetical protein
MSASERRQRPQVNEPRPDHPTVLRILVCVNDTFTLS